MHEMVRRFTLLVIVLFAGPARADDEDPPERGSIQDGPDACVNVRQCKRDDDEWRQRRLGRFAWQSLVDFGFDTYANTPDVEKVARVDAILRFGIRHFRGPEVTPAAAVASGVALLGGGGLVYSSDGRARWRADVTLSNSWQTVANPAPGHVFASVPFNVDVTVAYLGGIGDASDRVEVQVAGVVGGWGLYVRGGYNLGGPMQPTGGTLGFGYEANTLTFAKFFGRSLVGGLAGIGLSLVASAGVTWLVAHNRCERCEGG